jgi:hypothetical protein
MGQNDLWLSVALPRHHAGMRSSLYGKTDQWLSQHNPETSPEAEESGKAIEARPVFYKPRTRPSVGLLRHHAGCAFKGTAPAIARNAGGIVSGCQSECRATSRLAAHHGRRSS